MTKYLALLRGINVGGNNIIKMAELREFLTDLGLKNVQTYIQSGNVIFESEEKDRQKLSQKLEKELGEKFHYQSTLVLITKEEMEEIIKEAPGHFGKDKDKYRYDVIFLKEPLTAEEAIKEVQIKEGVDKVSHGTKALYFSRLISKAGQSRLSKIVQNPIYKSITIRNWNSSSKLAEMMYNSFPEDK